MIGLAFTILGIITVILLWGSGFWLIIIAIVATLYQASSLNEMFKEGSGPVIDSAQPLENFIASLVILGLFIYSFFI